MGPLVLEFVELIEMAEKWKQFENIFNKNKIYLEKKSPHKILTAISGIGKENADPKL